MKFSNELIHKNLDEIPQCVFDTFKQIGLPTNIAGYLYLGTSIPLMVREIGVMTFKLTGPSGVYAAVAQKWGVTKTSVERDIRHAIEVLWERGDLDTLYEFFGNSVNPNKGKPVNGEFLTTMAYALRKQILAEDRAGTCKECIG